MHKFKEKWKKNINYVIFAFSFSNKTIKICSQDIQSSRIQKQKNSLGPLKDKVRFYFCYNQQGT